MKNIIPAITIGLDLGDKKHAICVLDAEGEIIDERSITNHRESLRRLSLKYPGARIAHEVGSHSPWISRFLTELGHEVFVANPRKLRKRGREKGVGYRISTYNNVRLLPSLWIKSLPTHGSAPFIHLARAACCHARCWPLVP